MYGMSVLNDGLKKIGSKVFYMDAMLSKVTLPSTLEEILGSHAAERVVADFFYRLWNKYA